VLYEMATGRRAFDGATQASLISAIMRDTPRPMAELSPLSPPALERLVSALLAKDPADRIKSAHDVKLQLGWAGESIASGGASPARPGDPPASRGRGAILAWGIAALGVGLALAAWLLPPSREGPSGVGPVTSTIAPPEGMTLSPLAAVPLAISPDGSHIVFCARIGNGPDQLWVRALASEEPRLLSGTEEAYLPFFSPDSRSIAFFSEGKLRRVAVEGGPVTTIAEARDPRGGTWGRRDVIVFAPQGGAGLYMVKAGGGPVTAVTALDSTLGEATHRNPHFLPDGVHFLYLARRAGAGKGEEPTIYAASIERPGRTRVLGVASNVAYASGHLLYVSDGNLVAQPFDLRRRVVSGAAMPISDKVRMDERFSRGTFAVSQNGVLVFMTGASRIRSQLLWVDRDGAVLRTVGSRETSPSADSRG
jgi:serine/threonine-protein kinase